MTSKDALLIELYKTLDDLKIENGAKDSRASVVRQDLTDKAFVLTKALMVLLDCEV